MSNPSTTLDRPGAGTMTRIGQGTAVEQSRAEAEVKAAVVVAQQCPRDVQAAMVAMRESCALPYLAERAFFRYSRGGSQISGGSVYLARELARIWGNVQYGVSELRRDDDYGQSEMQAWAWDVQTNSRTSTTFIVPHMRDKTGGPVKLAELRDIYENNANQGARRVRECIFAILPPWFVHEAQDMCRQTNDHGGGKPLAQRVADIIKGFTDFNVTTEQLEEKIGRGTARWTGQDVALLQVIGRSIKNGEATSEEEFPERRIGKEDIAAQRAAAPAPKPAAPQESTGSETTTDIPAPPEPATASQLTKLHTVLGTLGVTKNDALSTLSTLLGRTLASSKDLTKTEAHQQIERLESCTGDADPLAALDQMLGEAAEQARTP